MTQEPVPPWVKLRALPRVWIAAGLATTLLLIPILLSADWGQMADAFKTSARWTLLGAFGLLLAEGIVTGLRIHLFAAGTARLRSAIAANAWYVLFLTIIPARLGEVAAIFVFERYLGQSRGAATASIISQRLFDMIVLTTAFLVAVPFASRLQQSPLTYLTAGAVLCAAAFSLYFLDRVLVVFIGLLRRLRTGRQAQLAKAASNLVLQARVWQRHVLGPKRAAQGLLLTIVKWCCNLGALILVLRAGQIDLSLGAEVAMAAAFNFLSAIPIQTIGGAGLGEVGLTGLLLLFGVTLPMAAGVSLLVRGTFIASQLAFWVLIILIMRLAHRS